MIRWNVKAPLEARGWTPYRLAKETGLTIPTAYKLAKDPPAARIDAVTLAALCNALELEPGDLLELTDP